MKDLVNEIENAILTETDSKKLHHLTEAFWLWYKSADARGRELDRTRQKRHREADEFRKMAQESLFEARKELGCGND